MKLLSLSIKNYRGIDSLDLDFRNTDNLVVLAGTNGAGKTSVLEACLLLLGHGALLARPLPKQDFELCGEIVDSDRRTTRIVRTSKGFVSEASNRIGVNHFQPKGKVFYFSAWRVPRLVGGVGLSTGRQRRPGKTEENTLWRLKQRLVNLKGVRGFSNDENDGFSSESLFRRLNEAWQVFYPKDNGCFDARVIPGTEENENLLFDVFYRRRNRPEDSWLSIDDLSAGEQEVLSMLGTLLIERTPFDLILVDEPELHLHVSWHCKMIRAIQLVSPHTQIISATHSPDFFDSVLSTQRFMLSRDKGECFQ